ncbi:TPA: hypothetical protein QC057_004562 [Bacillus cereus]|nr:hypothetical protein [Bacillus cereus]
MAIDLIRWGNTAQDRDFRNNTNENWNRLEKGYTVIEQIGDQANAIAELAINKANEASNSASSLQKQLDSIARNGDSSLEAAQARVDTVGNAHKNLKDRIDNDYSTMISLLEGGVKKTYTTDTLNSNVSKLNNGARRVRVSPTLTSYIYSDKHLKFNDGYLMNDTALINHEIATVNAGNQISGAQVSLDNQFSIFLTGIKPQFSSTDNYGIKYLTCIYNSNTEVRLRFDKSKNGLNLEVRKNDIFAGEVNLIFPFVMGDSINILITQNQNIEITVCVNNDKTKVYSGVTSQVISNGNYVLIPLNYRDYTLNLQGSSSYDSISVYSKKFDENKAIVTGRDNYNHTISYRQRILSGTGNSADWNEKIAGEVPNILHDSTDKERPYKIAIGGYNGAYTESLVGKTGFAYSKDLVNWTYVNNGNYCIDRYTEDGCLIKFRDKYYYYAETMPNRNLHLYTSVDFVNWVDEGIVASPDLDPALAQQESSYVSAGSPSAIVKDNKVYLFIEYGYTSNANHSNKVLVSDDGINFRKLSTAPDLFKREFCRPVLDPAIWTINNIEGMCEVNGVYYAWLSITNKTQSPTIFSMWEMKSDDLITWKFTGANFSSNAGDYISFACLSNDNKVLINGVYNTNNAIEILFLSREEQNLPIEFKKSTVNLVKDPYFQNINTTIVYNSWVITKSLPIVVSGGKVTYYKPEIYQGLVQFITGIKPNTLYQLTLKTNGRFVMSGYQDNNANRVEADFLQFTNDVDGSVIFKTGPTTNILSCAFTGFVDCPPVLELSNLILEEV